MGSSTKEEVDWMYKGPESIVNKEDYLLGKRLDKNFQLFSGDIAVEKNSKFDSVTSKSLSKGESSQNHAHIHNSMLDLDTVRKEDPLVAIKVREAKVRQEILDNPIRMKRLQKIIKGAMLKKMKKMAQEMAQQESDSSSSSSSSSSSEDENPPQRKKIINPRSPSPHRRGFRGGRSSETYSDRRRSSFRERSSHSGIHPSDSRKPAIEAEHGRNYDRQDRHVKRESNDEARDRAREVGAKRRERSSGKSEGRRRRHDSSSSRSPSPAPKKHRAHEKNSGKHRDRESKGSEEFPPSRDRKPRENPSSSDSSPERTSAKQSTETKKPSSKKLNDCDYSASDSDDDRRKKQFAGYGLVKTKAYQSPDRTDNSASEAYSSSYASRIPAALAKFNPSLQRRKQSPEPTKKSRDKQRLTEEEKKEKLREMSENARWREEQRAKNVRNLEAREEWEAREEEKTRGNVSSDSFIHPMLAKVTDTSSVESRVKSKRHGLQRGPGDMDRNFARR